MNRELFIETIEKIEHWKKITNKLKQQGNKVKVAEFFLDV
jgi:hypothetical protein